MPKIDSIAVASGRPAPRRSAFRRRAHPGFVFGHTHRAGQLALARTRHAPLRVWNCETFLDEAAGKKGKRRSGSFLLIGSGPGALAERVRLEWID